MKIALISPPLLKTPPTGYGGLEQVVYDLGVSLHNLGHDTTLIAPLGSYLCDGAAVINTINAPESVDVDWPEAESESYKRYKKYLNDFDIVHDHTWFGAAYLAKKENDFKLCHTHHGHLAWDPNRLPCGNMNLIAISRYMRDLYISQGHSSMFVYNGVDLNKYAFSDHEREERLIYLGRIARFKQPHVAIEVAVATKTPIDIVGGSFVESEAYINYIKMLCKKSNGLATLHLDATHEDKIRMLQRAKALLMPSRMQEPFGLVAVEAMACGTPVIAFDDGAIREVIGEDYGGGAIAKSIEDMIGYAGDSAETFDPVDCLERAQLFSRDQMAHDYVGLYQQILDGDEW